MARLTDSALDFGGPMKYPRDMSDAGRNYPSPGVHEQDGSPMVAFLTVRTAGRGGWLASADAHRWMRDAWQESGAWVIGHYMLMPDHLHLFCTPRKREFSIEKWITFWKSRFWRRHCQANWKWQSRGWHHRLRSADAYAQKLLYVRENPVRAGLVEHADDWPFKGKLHDLTWVE